MKDLHVGTGNLILRRCTKLIVNLATIHQTQWTKDLLQLFSSKVLVRVAINEANWCCGDCVVLIDQIQTKKQVSVATINESLAMTND